MQQQIRAWAIGTKKNETQKKTPEKRRKAEKFNHIFCEDGGKRLPFFG